MFVTQLDSTRKYYKCVPDIRCPVTTKRLHSIKHLVRDNMHVMRYTHPNSAHPRKAHMPKPAKIPKWWHYISRYPPLPLKRNTFVINCNIVWGNFGINLRNKVIKAAKYIKLWHNAGHLFKLLGWKNLACQQQIQKARWFTSLCTGWREIVCNLMALRIKSLFRYRAQTITKIPSAIVAPFSGTVFLVT